MTTFAELKARRGQAEIDRLKTLLESTQDTYETDPNYWKPTKDKAGNANALIRFLPAHPDEDNFFITYYDHFFKGPTGQYYVELSRTSLGKTEKDPVTDANGKIWKLGKSGENYIRKGSRTRRQVFESNILVVNDPAVPENNGKVFKYKYGKKIYEKLNDKLFPKEGSFKEPLVIYDLWDGANFILSIKAIKVDDQMVPNYDGCEFASPSPVAKNDKEIERIWNQVMPLKPAIALEKFKSYEDLEKRLREVIGNHDELFIKSHGGQLAELVATPEKQSKTVEGTSTEEADEDDEAFFESLKNS